MKDRVEDHNPYLDKISEIVGIYMETELRASKALDAESLSQIAAKLLAVLHIYLDNSEEHMFRVLLRPKPVSSKKYSKIYESIFEKLCSNIGKNVDSMSDLSYVRYLLMLKLWKKSCESADERKRIDDLAVRILGPRVPNRGVDMSKFLPFLRQYRGTHRLMKQSSFDVRKACEDFHDFEARINAANLDVSKNGFT